VDLLPTPEESFFYGVGRKDGLQLEMKYEKGLIYAEVCIDNRFEGYTEVVHGGMLFGILDVIMWYAVFMETKRLCSIKKTDMEFQKPVMCNSRYFAKGRLLGMEGEEFEASAWVEDDQGECCAKSTSVLIETPHFPAKEFVDSLDLQRTSQKIRDHFLSLLR
jgi:acyl-coenzyme A thioesterase PaaI-like protein